jgi:hypothetical protein
MIFAVGRVFGSLAEMKGAKPVLPIIEESPGSDVVDDACALEQPSRLTIASFIDWYRQVFCLLQSGTFGSHSRMGRC